MSRVIGAVARGTLYVVVAAVVVLAVTRWPEARHWLAVHTGTVNESGPYYGFFSGFGSDLGEITLFGAVVGLYRTHNCHEPRCWRLGRHPTSCGTYRLCRRHHPDVPDHVTHDAILESHQRGKTTTVS